MAVLMTLENKRNGDGTKPAPRFEKVPLPTLDKPAQDDGHSPLAILLVDDDADCRSLVLDAIAQCRVCAKVFQMEDGESALDFLHRRGPWKSAPRPSLVYLDIEMPGLGGQETLRRIRSEPEFGDIPVVMMSGVSDEEEMRRAAANGANSYTIKPASAEQFLRTVLDATDYWVKVHQHPSRHLPASECRR